MKILVVGKCYGRLGFINQYIEESGAELVLAVSGVGATYNSMNDKEHFVDFLNRKSSFSRPVVTIVGPYDDWGLTKLLIEKKLSVPNFYLLGRSIKDTIDTMYVGLRGVTISGIGGTYSPNSYNQNSVTGQHQRHYRKKDIDNLASFRSHIVMMYDVIGESAKNKVDFGDDTIRLFREKRAFYTFIGKHSWFGYVNTGHHNVLTMPPIHKGYLIIDTAQEWNATCVMPKITVN